MSITKDFILAGNATFTIDTPDAGHRTYRVRHKPAEGRWKECWFVDLLTGSDNETSYSYIGKLDDFTGQLVLTAKSKMDATSFAVRLLNRVLARVWADDHQAFESKGFKLHHEGTCGRCGRKLTVPESIESGFGPECVKKAGLVGKPASERTEEDERRGIMNRESVIAMRDWFEEKAQFARLEAIQEQLAFASDPDLVDRYGRVIPKDHECYAAARN